MKQTLQLRLGQHLAMTPQMQQAIRLLQVPAVELQAEIQQALEANMMLEIVDEELDGETHDAEATDWDEPLLDWSSAPAGPSRDAAEWAGDAQADLHADLHAHLRWQLELTPFGAVDAAIAATIIDCIDDDGYLHGGLEAVREALPHGLEAGDAELAAVLHRVQRFDPVGVAARSLAECLLVQLGQLRAGPVVQLARAIVEGHLDALADRGHAAIAKALGVDPGCVEEAADLIRTLDPRPGAGIAGTEAGYVVPDILVRRRDGHWSVEVNPELVPRLRVNPYYEGLAGSATDPGERACLKQHLQEARWLLRSLHTRAETLLQVASRVFDHQRDWLESGDTAMRPLVLREIAEALDMHESTVSRATAGKYVMTPRGLYEFRHFFSAGIAADGASATAVRAQIKRMIAEENPGEPLSDGRIAARLAEMGLPVARRTVAKYRESMSIPATPERRAHRQTS